MSGSDLFDLPADVLSEIFQRLDVVSFFRLGATCVALRRSTKHGPQLPWLLCKPKSRLPWLLLSSLDNPKSRFFYDPSEQKIHELRLPDIAGHHFVGSSHGFLISVDADADLHATNPLTGAHLPLPPTSTFPGIVGALRDPSSRRVTAYRCEYRKRPIFSVPVETIRPTLCSKVILSPSADAVVVLHNEGIAFARPGDAAWTPLFNNENHSYRFDMFQDAVFHKGMLRTITHDGRSVLFRSDPTSAAPLLSYCDGPDRIDACSRRYLVESPNGKSLFLVSRDVRVVDDGWFTTDVRVYLLDKRSYTWNPIKDLGSLAFFLGYNYSYSMDARKYPSLEGNHIYLTEDDQNGWLMREPWLMRQPDTDGDDTDGGDTDGGGIGADGGGFGVEVFNLKDRSKKPLYSSEDLNSLNRPPPLWFVPILK